MSLDDIAIVEKTLTRENQLDFFKYITELNLVSKKKEALVLASSFFYEEDEIEDIKIIINLKELNRIPKMYDFFDMILKIPNNDIFCGCFIDNKPNTNYSNRYSRFFDILLSLKDYPAQKRILGKKDVYAMFDAHGFKVINMEEINGVTYFYAKKQ